MSDKFMPEAEVRRKLRYPPCQCFKKDWLHVREPSITEFALDAKRTILNMMDDYQICEKAAPYAVGQGLAALSAEFAMGKGRPHSTGAMERDPEKISKHLLAVLVFIDDIAEHARDRHEVTGAEILADAKKAK